ncbi:hypothetical protein A2160_04350 [Candidatus Beckwithbacteria bacterium RBG_13_42_9]|uniref:Glycosyltransferase 2-like domain-containing protein n=1 Tax=Candidatus Beckwithbacteria bacterium RBG_13_42_9 TaxID=1797457 RepID=A0A1F5E6D3_9BACT|nr:MAG: hypothetical protein A2160_04350 [Candidatus Beckwithbacteria bacterium RBG_13_42_9]
MEKITKPFFSIIIPTLNEEAYLPLLLADLKKQTFHEWEAFVVDAQSKDRTVSLTKRFKQIKVIAGSVANVAQQRNLGAQEASGKYLIFTDADSRLPHYFLEGIKYRLSVTKADIFATWINHDLVQGADRVVVTFFNLILESGRFLDTPAATGAMLGCRRSLFNQLGGFDPTITFAEDSEFVQRAVKAGYHFELFKDPRFSYSLRRFKQEGTLPMLRKYAKLNLEWIINGFPRQPKIEYPMLGGSYYQCQKKTSPHFLGRLEGVLQKAKKLKNKQVLKRFIESLFLD